MSILKYFKNTPGRPPKGRQALSVFFFFKFATRSLEKKRGLVAPATGDRVLSPPLGRPEGGPAHGRGRGLLPPPLGRPGYPLI